MEEYKEPRWKQFLDRIGPMVLLNALFLLCCIPLFTIGAAWCGLYQGIRNFAKGEKWFPGFWQGFRSKFLSTALIGAVFHIFDLYFLYNTISIGYYQMDGFLVPLIASCLMTGFALMVTAALFPLRVYAPTDTAQWLRNSVSLATQAPLQSLLIGTLMFLPPVLLVCFTFSMSFLVLAIIAFYYSGVALTATLLYRKKLLPFHEKAEGVSL